MPQLEEKPQKVEESYKLDESAATQEASKLIELAPITHEAHGPKLPKAPRLKPLMSFKHLTAKELTSATSSDNWCPLPIKKNLLSHSFSDFTTTPLLFVLE